MVTARPERKIQRAALTLKQGSWVSHHLTRWAGRPVVVAMRPTHQLLTCSGPRS
ncbi:Mu transposase C-terminal domain-containing protein [Sphingopyxis alaskensis]|uniref:Mu transposase C-terminal domain-containing protein n=1 Tax=Sphingopyxis alaskensis TaxID=117207 RepID=UPI00199584B5|nr:Mu transposase C-terminal domain-containing protein [Sphingopyxis terrae]